jgi:hypothetical protein
VRGVPTCHLSCDGGGAAAPAGCTAPAGCAAPAGCTAPAGCAAPAGCVPFTVLVVLRSWQWLAFCQWLRGACVCAAVPRVLQAGLWGADPICVGAGDAGATCRRRSGLWRRAPRGRWRSWQGSWRAAAATQAPTRPSWRSWPPGTAWQRAR